MFKDRMFKIIIWFFLGLAVIYGAGRLYYYVTDGFAVSEISSQIPYNQDFDIKPLSVEEKNQLHSILSQEFHYLGKGCQSYVFASEDGNYVIKFLKYKHFNPQKWLNFFSFIPSVRDYQLTKQETKQKNLHTIFNSWKLAYEDLKDETGLIFVHLNKSKDLNQKIVIVDKIGTKSVLDSDKYEFLVQKRTKLLSSTLENHMKKNEIDLAKKLIDKLFDMLVDEYERGYGDNDHALVQNTGVLLGSPIHIDVGQFIVNENFKEINMQHQEMFNKTYRFRIWLKKRYPELHVHLSDKLFGYMGSKMNELNPILKSVSYED